MFRHICVLILVLFAFTGAAAALDPSEVLVVANSNSQDSAKLAKVYAKLRNIPEKNLVLVKTTTEYDISFDQYELQILKPIADAMTEQKLHEKIRCIVLMYGVPVRVGQLPPSGELGKVWKTLSVTSERTHNRLAIDYLLLLTVGRDFTNPGTDGLTPIGKLFRSPAPSPPEQLPEAAAIDKDLRETVGRKLTAISKIEDESKKVIASRQLMAVYRDAYGLEGLLELLKTNTLPGAPEIETIRGELDKTNAEIKSILEKPAGPDNIKALVKLIDTAGGGMKSYAFASREAHKINPPKSDASVDSELAMMYLNGHYSREMFLPNPLCWRYPKEALEKIYGRIPRVMLTCRIDGPSSADALRIISASIETEKKGLKGKLYIDAGGRYPAYDENLEKLKKFVERNTKFDQTIDYNNKVFGPKSCPNAALYVGWYSLKKYVPAFTWNEGAVGWHIASFEAMNLRDPTSNEWCVKMIQNGVAATIGAVNEPTLAAFPLPQDFFPLLMTGKYTLAECYWRTNPLVSWKMTLIGDPLYNPFAANPQVAVDKLEKGLAP